MAMLHCSPNFLGCVCSSPSSRTASSHPPVTGSDLWTWKKGRGRRKEGEDSIFREEEEERGMEGRENSLQGGGERKRRREREREGGWRGGQRGRAPDLSPITRCPFTSELSHVICEPQTEAHPAVHPASSPSLFLLSLSLSLFSSLLLSSGQPE